MRIKAGEYYLLLCIGGGKDELYRRRGRELTLVLVEKVKGKPNTRQRGISRDTRNVRGGGPSRGK